MQEINQFVLYSTKNGNVKLEIFLEEETLWLSQKMMAELFEVEVNTINYHIKEIFKSGELEEDSVIRKFRITAAYGKRYDTQYYKLPGEVKRHESIKAGLSCCQSN